MRTVWLLLVVLCAAQAFAKPARVRTRRGAVVFPGSQPSRGNEDGPILSEAGDTKDVARDTRDAAEDDEYEYEDVAEDGPEGRTFHKLKRKLKRKLKPHKWGLGHGGLLGGHGHHGLHGGHGHGPQFGGWQQPSYGPIAIAGPSHQHHGGWHRPPHHHDHHHGGWHKPSHFGGGGWNPGHGGWNPGYGGHGGPGYSASSWNLGPFSGSFAQSG